MSLSDGFSNYGCGNIRRFPSGGRIENPFEMDIPLISSDALVDHATRCLDCDVPVCHVVACPLHNRVPDICESLRDGRWREACDLLHSTNNFPEITGRVCSAPCELSCPQSADGTGIPIRQIEYQVAEYGFANDWVRPSRIEINSGKRVVVVGSGPAGLAAAQQLVRSGHEVIVFEKEDCVGGLLRYTIPYFRLGKAVLDRRLDQLRAEGITFITGIAAGEDVSYRYLSQMCDAVCVAIETGPPKDLRLPGRDLENVIFGTEYLRQANMIRFGKRGGSDRAIAVRDKIVAVIGGGAIGRDCAVLSRLEGARRTYQFEIRPRELSELQCDTIPTGAVENGRGECTRRWCVQTKRFVGSGKRVNELHGIEVEWRDGQNGSEMREKVGTEFSLKVDLVILAIGFEHCAQSDLIKKLGLRLCANGDVVPACQRRTGRVGLFATKTTATGASIVGQAIASGRRVAAQIDQYLVAGR